MNSNNLNFNAAFEAGMSSEDIIKQLKAQEAQYREEQEKKKKAAQSAGKAQLKAEARAYLINAIITYDEAFAISGQEWNEEEIEELERVLIQMEQKIPLMIKMYELQEKLKKSDDNDIMRFFQ